MAPKLKIHKETAAAKTSKRKMQRAQAGQLVKVSATGRRIEKLVRTPYEVSYKFPKESLFEFYVEYQAFQRLINTGKYAFVDQHLVLDSSKYISKNADVFHLTNYAVKHLNECCASIKPNYQMVLYRKPVAARRRPGSSGGVSTFGHAREFTGYSFIPAEHESSFEIDHSSFMDYISGGQEPPHDSFGSALVFLMQRENITEEELSEKTGISVRTIDRLRGNKNQPSLEHVIAICIVLKLSYAESELMTELAGYDISALARRVNPAIRAYRFLIEIMRYEWTVRECNEFLIKHDLSPLTKL